MIVSHAGIVAGVAFSCICLFVCLSVCLFVHTLTRKPLELSTPNLVHIYYIAVALHALTQRSTGQRSRSQGYENCHIRMVASDHAPDSAYLLQLGYLRPLPAWGLHVDVPAYVF